MAIISVFSKEGTINVLSCSEQHYVLSHKHSFINVELLLYCPDKIKEIFCGIHGKVIDEDTFRKELPTTHLGFFKKHVHLEDDTLRKKVLNYSNTFFWDIPTNKGYEGPNAEVKKVDSEKIEVYGVEAFTGDYSFKVIVDDEKYASCILIKEQSSGFFQEKKAYALRFGIIIEHNPPPKRLSYFFRIPYHVHYFSINDNQYKEKFRESFRKWGLEDYIKNCIVFTKVSKTVGLSEVVKTLSTGNSNCNIFHNSLEYPHTDIWLMIPQKWKIGKFFCKREIKAKGRATYLMYGSYEDGTPFNLYHVKISDEVDRFRNLSFIDLKSNEIMPFSFIIETMPVDLLEIITLLVAFLGIYNLIYNHTHSNWISLIFYLSALLIIFGLKFLRKLKE